MTSPTKAQLQEKLTKANEVIGRLEDEVETLERKLETHDDPNDEVGKRFAALVEALDDHVPLRSLPISLRLDLESLAEHLAVPLPIRRSA